MKPAKLLAHFDRISHAPDAVPRLRRFILDLAVQGKLVPQDPSDEPAAELLRRIEAQKAQLIKAGKVKNRETLTAKHEYDAPFSVPAGWQWARFFEVAVIQSRLVDPKDYQDLPHIAPDNIESGTGKLLPFQTIRESAVFSVKHLFSTGCILYSKIRPALAKAALADFNGLCSADMYPILSLVMREYLHKYMLSQVFVRQSVSEDNRVAMPKINQASLSKTLVAVPPLSEQRRIVAKVDELMALCDRLEAAQAERESRRDRLVAASLHRLNQPADTLDFREHVSFHLRHLPRLATRPEHVQQLRQTILNLAVRGKLVPQDPNDEPASELLKRIQKETSEPVKEEKTTRPLRPFQSPTGWQWVSFGDLITHSDSGWSPRTEGFTRSGNSWGVLKVSAVSWDRFLPEENKQLLSGVTPPEAARVRLGDFLISRANTSELVAKCVIVKEEPRNLILSDKIVRLQITEKCCKDFLRIVNNYADYARSYYAQEASGTSLSMKNVSRAVIYALEIPLPPIAEQHRIVAKVDELMAVCNYLEAQLATAQSESRHLLEAVLHETLAPSA